MDFSRKGQSDGDSDNTEATSALQMWERNQARSQSSRPSFSMDEANLPVYESLGLKHMCFSPGL